MNLVCERLYDRVPAHHVLPGRGSRVVEKPFALKPAGEAFGQNRRFVRSDTNLFHLSYLLVGSVDSSPCSDFVLTHE